MHFLQTFVFPDNVGLPFGGEGFPEYLVMELHYDNPAMHKGNLQLEIFLASVKIILIVYRHYRQLGYEIVVHFNSKRA